MDVEVVEPIVTVVFSLKEAQEFVKKNVPSVNHVPDISLLLADAIRKKLEEMKTQIQMSSSS